MFYDVNLQIVSNRRSYSRERHLLDTSHGSVVIIRRTTCLPGTKRGYCRLPFTMLRKSRSTSCRRSPPFVVAFSIASSRLVGAI